MAQGSKRAVLVAIAANAFVTVLKFVAAVVSGSAAMMNETIHSLMDTTNQGFLYRGLMVAALPPDEQYAFGHAQKKYLWNLWSAIGLFSIGAGLGMAHAYHAWQQLDLTSTDKYFSILGREFPTLGLSMLVLFLALIIEGYSFLVAIREFLKRMRAQGYTNPFRYLTVLDDPTLLAVVLEDSVAILGLILAATGIGLSALLGDPRWDIFFSVLIALQLAVVAIFLGAINMRFLTDIRDPYAEKIFQDVASSHWEVERYHDLRTIVLDEEHTILVAEIELREEAVLAGLQDAIDRHRARMIEAVPGARQDDQELQRAILTRATVEATIERTEQISEEIVSEVQRLLPRVSHATIEIEGIATPVKKAGSPEVP